MKASYIKLRGRYFSTVRWLLLGKHLSFFTFVLKTCSRDTKEELFLWGN